MLPISFNRSRGRLPAIFQDVLLSDLRPGRYPNRNRTVVRFGGRSGFARPWHGRQGGPLLLSL